jgi:asparagine synthase (glutamine-hydrolysing)
VSAIAGLWHRDGAPGSKAKLSAMLLALRHYGADGTLQWGEGAVGLGHCLTKVLPEYRPDEQPISLASGRIRLVADLRLDNRDELSDKFGWTRSQAEEMSDASMLGRAYERWGADCLNHVLGDYSFAVWNELEQSWFLARDPAGSLPLYYFLDESLFAFASMPIGLLALPQIPCEPHEEWISQQVELIARPAPENATGISAFRHIRRVPAGHFVRVSRHGESIHQYWNPPQTLFRLSRPEEYHEALREQMDAAVGRRLRGVRNVASYLSGGLDSSSVSATAARLQLAHDARVTAYTAVPQTSLAEEIPNRFADEREHASATAALYSNVDHILITSKSKSPFDSLSQSFHLYQQPVLHLCNLAWLWAIQDDARARGLGVILSGAAGNHTISYTGLDMLPALARSTRWHELWKLVSQLHRRRGMSWRSLGARSMASWIPEQAWFVMTPFLRGLHSSMLSDLSLLHPARRAQRRHLPVAPPFLSGTDTIRWRMFLLQRSDPAALRKGTLAGWDLDERDPTCDRRLMEFCFSVPASEWMRGGLPSALLRDGLSDRLPETVRYETRRGLQGTDWHIEATRAKPLMMREIESLEASPCVSEFLVLP